MSLDREDAERIARELIAEIGSKWEDTSRIVCVKDQHDAYIFVFALPPAPLMRNGVLIERPAAFSTFHFDPLAEATEIVARCDFDLGLMADGTTKDTHLRQNAKERINEMLLSAADIFSDAMWEARITAETLLV